MRSFLLLLLAPVAVLSVDVFDFATPTTGQICCDHGAQDPSGTCKTMGLNAYGCLNFANDESAEFGDSSGLGGCDRLVDFKVGCNVFGFAENVPVKKPLSDGNTIVGFIGCAV
ncbi:hypothetical protein LZ30DRAFT_683988 [Colletotrichum cereale]|nr:hypothetical protein LZ30DRAFT_683988 [Colletotrichum cereale]